MAAYRQSVLRTPHQSPDRGRHLSNLGSGWMSRFVRTNQVADLVAAVEANEEAVAATPSSSPELPMHLNNLSSVLRTLYRCTLDSGHLERAVAHSTRAVELSGNVSLEQPLFLAGLASALDDRFAATGDLTDLDRSIAILEDVVERAPKLSVYLPAFLTNLGVALSRRLVRTDTDVDRKRLGEVWSTATRAGLADAPSTLINARNQAAWAFREGAWETAAGACDTVIEVGERLFVEQIARPGKASWLRELRHVPAMAAYTHGRCGDLVGAILASERGRVRLLLESLDLCQADLESLRHVQPALVEQYRAAAAAVLALEENHQPQYPLAAPPTGPMRSARETLAGVVEEIRRQPGYEQFLVPINVGDLTSVLEALPEDAALVHLSATGCGSVALLSTRRATTAEWLKVTQEEIHDLLFGQPNGGYLEAIFESAKLDTLLEHALPQIGEWLIGPIAARLRADGVRQVVIIPTGYLAALPLHAARYDVNQVGACFLDEFTVSYAPGVRVLGGSLRRAGARCHERFLIGVANPPGGEEELPGTVFELSTVAQLFGAGRRLLHGPAATRSAVLGALAEGTHLHFACHGFYSREEPLQSGLQLAGGEALSLRDLVGGRIDLSKCRLVVLAACQTAVSDSRDLPDEFIGLPAGFLQAGAPGVVGTLWPVEDLATSLVMIKFYENLFAEASAPLAPARALCRAQAWLRDLEVADLAQFVAAYPRLDNAVRRSPRLDIATASRDRRQTPFACPSCWAPFVLVGC